MDARSCAVSAISNQLAAVSEDKGYITIREVARRSSMSEKSIRNFIRNDALPHYRNSRSGKIWLRWTEFVEWMERRRIEFKHDDQLLSILRDMNMNARSKR
jgi:predicted DNA-binding transcriptional regulator AlpA